MLWEISSNTENWLEILIDLVVQFAIHHFYPNLADFSVCFEVVVVHGPSCCLCIWIDRENRIVTTELWDYVL